MKQEFVFLTLAGFALVAIGFALLSLMQPSNGLEVSTVEFYKRFGHEIIVFGIFTLGVALWKRRKS